MDLVMTTPKIVTTLEVVLMITMNEVKKLLKLAHALKDA